jgi:uncharacterized membrane protein YphA (DoxX/SURF4 family)
MRLDIHADDVPTTKVTYQTGALLWTIQALLALLFLFAGSMKFIMPIEAMTADLPLPGLFLRFVGVCEIAGALGLVLPGIFHFRASLTPLAAAGLLIIMIGATIVTIATGQIAAACVPFVVGLLLAFVAYRHWQRASNQHNAPKAQREHVQS